MVIRIEASSATVMAHQTPSKPKKRGKIKTAATSKTTVRRKEIAAETIPLFNAVKNEDAKILKPANRNANENSRNA